MKKFKRCAYCAGRIWGTPRLYVHMFGMELVLQCWTHDKPTAAGKKACDQLLNERITKVYVDTGDMIAALGPYVRFDTRATEGVHGLTDTSMKKPQTGASAAKAPSCPHVAHGLCPSCVLAAEVAEQVRSRV